MNSLNDARAGHLIILTDGYGLDSVEAVARVTDTQILLNGAMEGTFLRYRKDCGRKVGESGWRTSRISAATPERIEKVKREDRHRKLAYAMGHRNWKNVSLENMERIEVIMRERAEIQPAPHPAQ